MPNHEVTNGLSQKRFLFLWRHFHLEEEIEDEVDFFVEEEEDGSNELVDIEMTTTDINQEQNKNNDEEQIEDHDKRVEKKTRFGLIRLKYF